MRGNRSKGSKANHIVIAWSKDDGFSLGQKVVDEKSNEIAAISELLKKINIKGQVVTIDAMGTQTAIAESIRKGRADYVLDLKGNKKVLHEELSLFLNDEEEKKKLKQKGMYKKTKEKSHGQIEIREYYHTEEIEWIACRNEWKGLKSKGKYQEILEKAKEEYILHEPSPYYRDGYNLYRRMQKYKTQHLLFLHDMRVPTTNNTAERCLRDYKRKQTFAMTFRSFESLEELC